MGFDSLRAHAPHNTQRCLVTQGDCWVTFMTETMGMWSYVLLWMCINHHYGNIIIMLIRWWLRRKSANIAMFNQMKVCSSKFTPQSIHLFPKKTSNETWFMNLCRTHINVTFNMTNMGSQLVALLVSWPYYQGKFQLKNLVGMTSMVYYSGCHI